MGKVLLCSSSVGLFPAPPKQLNAKAADVLQEMLGMLFIYLFCLTAASTGAKKKKKGFAAEASTLLQLLLGRWET